MDIKSVPKTSPEIEETLQEENSLKAELKEKNLIIQDLRTRLDAKIFEETYYTIDEGDQRIKDVKELEEHVHRLVMKTITEADTKKDFMEVIETAWRLVNLLEKYRETKINLTSMSKFAYPRLNKFRE